MGTLKISKKLHLREQKKTIKKLLQPQTPAEQFAPSESQPEFFYWKPPADENRVVVQYSCFIFSARSIDPVIYKEISISKEDKKEILMLLKKYYGIDNQSIFRDFGGFAASQGQAEPITLIDPTSGEQWLQSANEYFRQGKYQEAIADYDRAIRINSQATEAYFNRGIAKAELSRHEEAIADYDQAIRLNPEDATAYNNRGNAKAALGQHKEAIADYDQAIRLNPQIAQAYYNRGNAKYALDRHEEALADYNEAIRLNPQFAQAYTNRGNAKAALDRPEEALTDYNEAIHLNPQYAEAYYNRGISHNTIRKYEKARADWQRTLKLATEQGHQALAQDARKSLDELPPPAGGEE